MLDFMKLQHGNTILGIAGGGFTATGAIDSSDEITLSEEAAGAIAGAFAYWLGFKVGKNPYDLRICVGQDPRISGDTLKTGLFKGITMFGAEPYDTGLAVSSAMYMSTVLPQLDFDGAIMITAGGRLREWNGFRLFTKEGELDADEVAKILKTASRYNFVGEYFEENRTNALQMYAAYLRQMISLGLKDIPGCLSGMHIVVNAGNGAGGFFAKDVLEPMGADISGSRYLEPDGLFPNHAPDTSNKEALDVTCISVMQNEADLGIVFSADAGRVAVIGPDGRPISPDAFIALAAALAAEDYPGGTVITDSATSDKLHEFLENDLGLKHLRYKSGFSNIIRKAKELNNEAFLAADTSGNVAYSDNSFFDDGVFLATQIVINAAQLKSKGKTIMDLIGGLGAPAESCEILFRLAADKNNWRAGSKILEDMEKWVRDAAGMAIEVPNFEGVRVKYKIPLAGADDAEVGRTDAGIAATENKKTTGKAPEAKGWFLIRESLDEPALLLSIESDTEGGVDTVLPLIYDFLSNYQDMILL